MVTAYYEAHAPLHERLSDITAGMTLALRYLVEAVAYDAVNLAYGPLPRSLKDAQLPAFYRMALFALVCEVCGGYGGEPECRACDGSGIRHD